MKNFKNVGLLAVFLLLSSFAHAKDISILNVSYDPTREFYKDYNELFAKFWKDKTGDVVEVKQSHGGGGKQARAVLDGLEADVVTFAISSDIQQLSSKRKLLPENWQSLLANNSSPYTSTMVYVVRKGNPKGIKDWNDLVRPGVSIITPNPKTSGGARWNYVAAWAYALKNNNNSEVAARDFLKTLFKNVPVLDAGARGATTTFAEREIGDVLITWENEAHLVLKEFGADKFEVVVPPFSVLAEPPVAVVEEITKKHGTTEVASAYLKYLYSKEGQDLISKHYYRPFDKEIAAKYTKQFPALELITISQLGGWDSFQDKHFADGGVFDTIYQP